MAERPEDLNLPNAVITRIIKEAVGAGPGGGGPSAAAGGGGASRLSPGSPRRGFVAPRFCCPERARAPGGAALGSAAEPAAARAVSPRAPAGRSALGEGPGPEGGSGPQNRAPKPPSHDGVMPESRSSKAGELSQRGSANQVPRRGQSRSDSLSV